MGDLVKMTEFDAGGVDDDRVTEWEVGLPNVDELTPLSQPLIPPELASAFSITPEPYRTNLDVNRASQNTLSSIRGNNLVNNSNNLYDFDNLNELDEVDVIGDGSGDRKVRRVEVEEAEVNCNGGGGGGGAAAMKRPRLVWTPQLHKRFVDVVGHLGIKNAVPKTIMQLMNVEGLTRENVASHLQKYRLYLKRMQGLSNEGPSASDQLFASTPVPQSLHESTGGNGNGNGNGNGHVSVPMPMPYVPQMMPMPVFGHMGMAQPGGYPGFEYNMNMMQQMDWTGNKFGSVNSYQRDQS